MLGHFGLLVLRNFQKGSSLLQFYIKQEHDVPKQELERIRGVFLAWCVYIGSNGDEREERERKW